MNKANKVAGSFRETVEKDKRGAIKAAINELSNNKTSHYNQSKK